MAELRNSNFALEGFDNLYKLLAEVKVDVKMKGGRYALRKTADVLAERVRERARKIDDPATAENIAANIAVRFSPRRFKQTGNLAFRVGVMGGARQYSNSASNRRRGRAGQTYETGGDKRNPGGDTWYWRLVEFGTADAPAQPFMRPAIQASQDVLVSTFAAEYQKGLDRLINRLRKKSS